MHEPTTTDTVAREVLSDGARALAHEEQASASLRRILDSLAARLAVASAAVVATDVDHTRLEIVASHGLRDADVAGLARAIGNPAHPIARTIAEPTPTFDVAPTVPGGPALRSHLPLVVVRDGSSNVLGVLALAYEDPFDADTRRVLQAVADLAAVALERIPRS
jgi:GAF domain-containing protein